MKPSKYQKEIYDTYNNTSKNIVISATAGSGKSTTLVELAKLTPSYKKVGFFAFNKSIAAELDRKTPQNIYCSTIHSLGIKSLYANLSDIKISEKKSWQFINTYFKGRGKVETSYKVTMLRLLDLYRMYMVNNLLELIEIALQRSIVIKNGELQDLEMIILLMNEYNDRFIVEKDYSEKFEVDFTDMLYLPVKYNLPIRKFDVVMIDEGQDLNKAQMQLVEKAIKNRFILVGDEKQAIYQFMGSTVSIFEDFKNKPNTVVLPLSVSYRCSKAVVREAQKVFNDIDSIQVSDSAIEGSVVVKGNYMLAETGDFVICRNNKPLFELFIEYLGNNKKAFIFGKDLGEQLERIIDESESENWDEALNYYSNQIQTMAIKLMEEGVEKPSLHPKVQSYMEKIEILKILFDRFGSFKEMKRQIKIMFSDKSDEDGVVLITIHKVKGLEAKNVYFHQPQLIPSKFAKSEEEIYAEKCLKFVAITRAKENLIYC